MNHRSVFCLLFFSVSVFGFSEAPGIYQGTDLSKILNKPQIISSSVVLTKDEDASRWIDMYADVHVFTEVPFEEMFLLVHDFENFPAFFKRVKRVKLTQTAKDVFLEMTTSVSLMGINFETVYTMKVDEPLNDASRCFLDYSFYFGDGQVKDGTFGAWYLEAASAGRLSGTYIRYAARGVVLKKYPLQDTVMSMFVNKEHTDILNQLLKAAKNRSR
jgi:hypothetical protein